MVEAAATRTVGKVSDTRPILRVDELTLEFGGVRALSELSFDVPAGEFCAIIGPNGAGKSSLFNCIGGLYRPTGGRIDVNGVDTGGLAPHRIAGLGVARTFQNIALADTMSVRDNVVVGAHQQLSGAGASVAAALRLPASRRREREVQDRASAHLDFLGLADSAEERVMDLSYGTRKLVELARAMMSQPTLLLVDEPAAGLSHGEVDRLGETIASLQERYGLTVLLVEHHMGMVKRFAERCVVLNAGRVIADGTPVEVTADPEVITAYLGTDA